ncbi:two component transcriptional regulator, LuxR family [Methylocaldum marinum]|uniref:Two component transcriptional regulator, LuxR family n=1 Tax=Methylocaldum marinum TaxID=1432792 RepID=A0A250KSX8_9GAMM|nr:response regulator transcription factor [Methylocaldum marinum]BBA34765.1 two component transcriptional regulator, LuxR family [Methylocaldum marinum]
MSLKRQYRQGTVMIVDDVPANLALLSDALEEAGYRVLVATDGASALEQLRYADPDVILMDAVMPGMDGFETCRHLKANPATRSIPIIFMTGLGELNDLLRGFREGAVDYLVKPIRHEEVLARVGAHVAQARTVLRVEEALDRSGFATISIDAAGRIVWLTSSAVRWLAAFSGTQVLDFENAPRYLPKALLDWALDRIASDGTSENELFTLHRDGKKFTARLAPCENVREYLLLLQEFTGDWNLESLRENLGLTFREAEILMWIARGKTNREVGTILGSSPRTVNKHLEHIFEKLGVGTRAAAVAVVMERMGTGAKAA